MKKPNLSFWQIWNLSFGFLGVQIGYTLQNSNTSTIFEPLGADHIAYSYDIGGAILLATVPVTSFVALMRSIPRVMLQRAAVSVCFVKEK